MVVKNCAIIEIDTLTKAQLSFLKFCKELGYGRIRVTIKNGEPVLASQTLKDIKFD